MMPAAPRAIAAADATALSLSGQMTLWAHAALIAAVAVVGTILPATAQFATADKTYKYFVEFCGDPFPNVEMTRRLVAKAGWQAAGTATTEIANWLLNDPESQMLAYFVQTKRIQNKGYCSLAFDRRAPLPLQRLVERYAFRPDIEVGTRMSAAYPQYQFDVFIKTVDTGLVNLVLKQSKDDKSGDEIIITNLRVM